MPLMPSISRFRCLIAAVLIAGAAAAQSSSSGATMGEAAKLREDREFERAALIYESIVRSQPNNADAWFMLALTLHEMGEYDRAIYVFNRASEFPQYRSVSFYNQGCAHALAGRKDEAFAALRRALDAGYVNRSQYETDKELLELKDDPRWQQLFGIDEEGRNHELDFLLGRWVLIGPDGRRSGRATAERRQNGFLIHEEVELEAGITADRFYYYDPRDHVWRLTSVDARGGMVRARGRYSEGVMTFEGGRVNPDSTELRCRVSLSPAQNNTLLYSQEIAYEGGDWRTVLQARYVRRSGDGEPTSGPSSRFGQVRPGFRPGAMGMEAIPEPVSEAAAGGTDGDGAAGSAAAEPARPEGEGPARPEGEGPPRR